MLNGRFWFLLGCVFLGLLIGLITGLSISPIVGTVVGLVFAFAGGSIIVLIKGRSETDLDLIGKSLASLSIFMIIGIAIGITFRQDYLDIFSTSAPFKIEKRLTVDDVIDLSLDAHVNDETLIALLRADGAANKEKLLLGLQDIKKMATAGVKASVINAMFSADYVFQSVKAEQSSSDSKGSMKTVPSGNSPPHLHGGPEKTPEQKLLQEN